MTKRSAAELQRVIGEEKEGRLGAEPVAGRKADAKRDVQRCRERDQPDAPDERERETEAEIDHGDRDRLAGDRQPAETNQRLEAEASAGEVALGRRQPGTARLVSMSVIGRHRVPGRGGISRFLRLS